MTREEIIEKHPLWELVEERGFQIKNVGGQFVTNCCPIENHKQGHLCVTISPSKDVWHCNDHDKGGSVIDWIMTEKQMTTKEAMTELGGVESRPHAGNAPPGADQKEVAVYNYTNENGQLLFQVVRYEPKSFRQRQPKGDNWQWNLDNVTRVIYNLPKVMLSSQVAICEGEKDADNVTATIGIVATTNAGGSNGWLDAYGPFFKGKDVIVFPDSDPAGRKRADHVIASIRDHANSVKLINMPDGFKDISDFIEAKNSGDEKGAVPAIQALLDKTPHIIEPTPIYSVLEREQQYRDFVRELPKRGFSMSRFSPKFNKISSMTQPGEVIMIVGDTGIGKTAIMQTIARSAKPLPTLIFELELPLSKMFQREMQIEGNCYAHDVIEAYKKDDFTIEGRPSYEATKHIMICPQSGLTMDTVEKYITKSELKFGAHPVLVMIDYMGLIRKDYARSRYEAMAYAAEQAKVIAKRTSTVVIIGSQVGRPMDKKVIQDVELHHAKGAGELESSSNLVLGCSRPDEQTLRMKVLKNNDGPNGDVIDFDFDGAKMQIRERQEIGREIHTTGS